MMNFINTIPENIGWVIVGVVGTLCAMMLFKLGKIVVEMIKLRLEDEEAEEEA